MIDVCKIQQFSDFDYIYRFLIEKMSENIGYCVVETISEDGVAEVCAEPENVPKRALVAQWLALLTSDLEGPGSNPG
jgi:hypothetical protein